jgi:hypothetical protein
VYRSSQTKRLQIVGCGKAFVRLSFVLPNALLDVACESDVKGVAAAGHDVCIKVALLHGECYEDAPSARFWEEKTQVHSTRAEALAQDDRFIKFSRRFTTTDL